MLQPFEVYRPTGFRSAFHSHVLAATTAACLGLLANSPAYAVEAKSFAINWFALAMNPTDKDCPQKSVQEPVGTPGSIARASLRLQGYTEEEVERRAKEFESVLLSEYDEADKKFADFTTRRARIDGKPADAYLNPLAAPNPKIPKVVTRMQYGFNLDGKGAGDKVSVEDPETHERGVDNEYARAAGCITAFRFKTNTGAAYDTGMYWFQALAVNRVSLITVFADDLSKDGEAIAMVRHSLDLPILNSKGEMAADATFRVDPDPRTQNSFRGSIKNGVFTSTEPVDFWLASFNYKLIRSRLRVELGSDGAARGMIGGYRPWRDIYAPYTATPGRDWEFMSTVNLIGLFYNLRDAADAFPDDSGRNTAISAAYKFEAVPAFAAAADGKSEPPQLFESMLTHRVGSDRVAEMQSTDRQYGSPGGQP